MDEGCLQSQGRREGRNGSEHKLTVFGCVEKGGGDTGGIPPTGAVAGICGGHTLGQGGTGGYAPRCRGRGHGGLAAPHGGGGRGNAEDSASEWRSAKPAEAHILETTINNRRSVSY